MAVLDGAIANVALADDRAASSARRRRRRCGSINAYQLTITVLLLPLAALGDRIGLHVASTFPGSRCSRSGSVGCALAPQPRRLIVARVFQGVGAACIMSMNAALVRATYPASMLGRGIGYNALVLSMSGRGRADAGRDHPQRRLLAVAVPDQPADRDRARLSIELARSLPDAAAGMASRSTGPRRCSSAAMMGCIVFGVEMFAREGIA